MKLFLLVPMVCLLGCGDPGPVSRTDAGDDATEDAETIPDAGGNVEGNPGFETESGLIGCDCYTCPYGLGCRPSTTQPPPNPTTVHYPHGNPIM